ncbi:MAG: NfeD family protein [Prevotellaceae bacterium]|jgi:membrane-bound ClpP family serine protease|nr:NfeD family protein [Prevotellaceae bacterium]
MTTVIILIVLGVLLLVAEIVVLPGIGFAGIAGGASVIIGIILSYNISETAGHWTVFASIILCTVAMYFSLRAKTWQRLALNKNIDSSVDVSPALKNIQIGDEGIAITRLSPTGKVRIKNVDVEARSILRFIDHNAKIVVIKFEDSKVIVKEIENKN